MTVRELQEKIKAKRKEMYKLAEKFGLQSSEVLAVSKEMDTLICQYLTKSQLLKMPIRKKDYN